MKTSTLVAGAGANNKKIIKEKLWQIVWDLVCVMILETLIIS